MIKCASITRASSGPWQLFIYFLSILMLLGVSACQQIKDRKEIKLAHSLDVTHSVHIAMEYMADRVAEKSNGKLKIDIYPSGQLGSEREALELLQIGSLGMTKVSAATMENFAPAFKVFSLPYIFNGKEHLFKVIDGEIGKDLLSKGEEFWLHGLTYYDAGSRSFYTVNKPVQEPEDLKGMKIRVLASNTAVNMIQAFGGSATPISWGELYTALQQGVVDGAENNPPSFYLSRHYEVAKNYTLDEHTMIPDVLLISSHIWSTLTPQEQTWVKEAAEESAVYQRELWAAAEEEALEAVKKAGVKVIIPDKKSFAQKVEPMYERYKSEPKIHALIRQIQDAGKSDPLVDVESN
jgi:tripartite ATP-independent transporter DctP family solute receptor